MRRDYCMRRPPVPIMCVSVCVVWCEKSATLLTTCRLGILQLIGKRAGKGERAFTALLQKEYKSLQKVIRSHRSCLEQKVALEKIVSLIEKWAENLSPGIFLLNDREVH